METFLADVRHALRQLWRSPSFTFAAVAALALGIGVNTAIFSVVDAVLLKPVPFPDPDRLVFFMNTSPQGQGSNASPAMFGPRRKNLWPLARQAFATVVAASAFSTPDVICLKQSCVFVSCGDVR